MLETMLLIHIAGGGLALVAGFVALNAAKGEGLHLRSGRGFVYSMLAMGASGAGIAAVKAQPSNVAAGLLALYLVVTALTTVRSPTPATRRLNFAAMLVALAVSVGGLSMGSRALAFGDGTIDGSPAAVFVVLGVVALLAGASDLRLMRSGEPRGVPRLRRHLWRMCFALFIASGSFFLGQADEIPEPLRILPLLLVPALLPLAGMAYWLVRVRTRRRAIGRRASPEAAGTPSPLRS